MELSTKEEFQRELHRLYAERCFTQMSMVLTTALQTFPNDPDIIYFNIALCEVDRRYDEADRHVSSLLKHAPDHPQTLHIFGFGRLQNAKGNRKKSFDSERELALAEHAFARAAEIQPSNLEHKVFLAECWKEQGRLVEASSVLDSISLDNIETPNMRHLAFVLRGELELLIDPSVLAGFWVLNNVLENAIALGPAWARTYKLGEDALMRVGATEASMKYRQFAKSVTGSTRLQHNEIAKAALDILLQLAT